MQDQEPGLRWGVERRLEFIEFRLYWEGRINRSDITRYFRVSVPQASKDLSQYQEHAPDNLEYDKSEKCYLAAPSFKPRFFRPDPDKYLAQLRSIGEHISEPEETWLSNFPPLDCLPILRRKVDENVLRTILTAVREKRSVDIHYQSMNPEHPEPMWRGISPHAFGSDGFRWHVRAFCHRDDKFKDFLLSRTLDCRLEEEAKASSSGDADWHAFFEVVLKPNPKLSQTQQSTIAGDFHMDNNKSVLPVRKALLYYFEKRLRFDVSQALDNPQEAPVVIANKKDFDEALAEAKGQLDRSNMEMEEKNRVARGTTNV
ncbi:MAG: WYL domain-containing protein [Candidatus Thiodiazotropha sp.]